MGFWDAFTGKSARKDIDKGIAAVNAGTDKAVGAFQQYGEQARGELAPYREQGAKAFTTYNDTLGINGTAARDAAQGTYLSDPVLAQQRALDLKRSGQVQNASGSFNSGTAALADSRVRLQDYGNWQNRLAGVGQQGQQAATTTAGIDQNTGAGIASSYQNSGAQTANLYGQRAQTQNALAQNLIGLGGIAVSAMTGMPVGVNNLAGKTTTPGTQANGGWQTTTTPTPWYNPQRWFG